MKVVVMTKWGRYEPGDVIEDMPESTALACINHGVIRDFDAPDLPIDDEVVPDPPVVTEEVPGEAADEVVPEKETEVKPVKEKSKNA